MDNFNTLLLLEFLSLRRRQFDTHQQILRNEETCIERSYNLLFSHFRGLNRLSNTQTTQTTETNDFANEMTGILSSLRRNVSRRSTPSLSTQSTDLHREIGRLLRAIAPPTLLIPLVAATLLFISQRAPMRLAISGTSRLETKPI